MAGQMNTRQVRELARALKAAGRTIGKSESQVVTASANAIAREARRRVPIKSGKLHDSIKVHVNYGVSATVYADARNNVDELYAHYVEYGTSRTPAQPFIHPAADWGEYPFYEAAEKEAIRILEAL